MTRRLEDAWRRQLAFTMHVLTTLDRPLEQLTADDRTRLTKEYCEALHSEVVEVLNTQNWKKHRATPVARRDELLEELVDVQKYLWGLFQVHGITIPEFMRAYDQKSEIVEQRFTQEHELPKLTLGKKVAVVDIDDTVAEFVEGFELWALKREPSLTLEDIAPSRDPALRKRLKEKFYAEGGMRELNSLPTAFGAVVKLQDAGYTIVWLTARPITRHPRILGDTIHWLKYFDFPWEYIYWTDLNKALFVLDKWPTVEVLFDNELAIVADAQEGGVRAYLVKDGDLDSEVDRFLEEVSE